MSVHKKLIAIVFACVLVLPLVGCQVREAEEGELPDVDVQAEGGELPEYQTETVPMEEAPDIDVTTEEETVGLPEVDVETDEPPPEGEPYAEP